MEELNTIHAQLVSLWSSLEMGHNLKSIAYRSTFSVHWTVLC